MTQGINLQTASLQEIFTFVAEALLKQGKPSISAKGNCLYRGSDGCKCAAGWLIPDEEYAENIEGKSVHGLSYFQSFVGLKLTLISDLQRAHDNTALADTDTEFYPNETGTSFVSDLTAELEKVAAKFNLSREVLSAAASGEALEVSNG